MSLAKSHVFSNETLADGVDHLNRQQMKCEKTPDRQEMEKELKERSLQLKDFLLRSTVGKKCIFKILSTLVIFCYLCGRPSPNENHKPTASVPLRSRVQDCKSGENCARSSF